MIRYLALILLAWPLMGATATCWPTDSKLKAYNEYFCAVDTAPGEVVTGRQLMAALAELEPVPESLVSVAGGDQNRISPRNVLDVTEQYILPGISAATALEGIKIKETSWQTLVVLSPILFTMLKGVIFGTAPAEWTRPPSMIGEGELPVDSRGSASAALYTRRSGGVRRVTVSGSVSPTAAPTAPSEAAPLSPGFIPGVSDSKILGDRQNASTARPQERHLRSGVTLQRTEAEIPQLRRGERPPHQVPPELADVLDTDDIRNPLSREDVLWIAEYYRSLNNEAEAEAVLARGYQLPKIMAEAGR